MPHLGPHLYAEGSEQKDTVITFHCDPGYDLKGVSSLECTEDTASDIKNYIPTCEESMY